MSLKSLFAQFVRLVHPDLLLSCSDNKEMILSQNRRIMQLANMLMENNDSKNIVSISGDDSGQLNFDRNPLPYCTIKDGILTTRRFYPKLHIIRHNNCYEQLLLQLFESAGLNVPVSIIKTEPCPRETLKNQSLMLNQLKPFKNIDSKPVTYIPVLLGPGVSRDLKYVDLGKIFTLLSQPVSSWKVIILRNMGESMRNSYLIIPDALLVVIFSTL